MTDEQALKDEITHLNQCLRHKNLALDALGYVWCSGGCASGVFRFSDDIDLTELQVNIVEQNTIRLRQWFEAKRCRGAQDAETKMDKCCGCHSEDRCFEKDKK